MDPGNPAPARTGEHGSGLGLWGADRGLPSTACPWTPAPPAPARTREHGMLDLTKGQRGFPGSRTHSLHVRPAQAGDLIDAFHTLLEVGGKWAILRNRCPLS